MPKKHKRLFPQTSSASAHPSLTLSNTRLASGNHGSAEQRNESVNDALRNLRLEDAKTAVPVPPPATDNASLRWLLSLEAGPLNPPPRDRGGPVSQRRAAGPAAPPSWQTPASQRTPHSSIDQGIGRRGEGALGPFYHGRPLPGGRSIPKASLVHVVLENMARSWDWHLDYDHEYMSEMPLPLKEIALSYLARLAPNELLNKSSRTLRLLFPDAYRSRSNEQSDGESIDGAEDVVRLDLGRAIGTWLPDTSSLKRELLAAVKGTELSSTAIWTESVSENPEAAVPESWEDETTRHAQHGRMSNTVLFSSSNLTSRFSSLLHLSLALQPSKTASDNWSIASWPSLLKITRHLSTLQSLSLAFWPRPALTPRAAAASVSFKHPSSPGLSVVYGGTGFYTEDDADWREASGILRRLSADLYCLQWLDLTGCGEWFGALSWTGPAASDDSLDPEISPPQIGLDWNGSWRNVHYLGLAVGWAPAVLEIDEARPQPSSMPSGDRHLPGRGLERQDAQVRQSRDVDISSLSHARRELVRQDWDVEEERKKYWAERDIRRALAIHERARQVGKHIRAGRERAKGRWMDVDGLEDGR